MTAENDAACRRALVAMTGEAESIERLIEREEAAPADPFGLDPIDRVTVRLWTSPHPLHRLINGDPPVKRDPSLDADIALVRTRLIRAVSKLPRYGGLCFRGVTLPRLAELRKVYAAGNNVTWNRFSSASTDPARALPGTVVFTIVSQTARRLQGYAADDSEQEVLFLPGTVFRVITCDELAGGLTIELAEIVGTSS